MGTALQTKLHHVLCAITKLSDVSISKNSHPGTNCLKVIFSDSNNNFLWHRMYLTYRSQLIFVIIVMYIGPFSTFAPPFWMTWCHWSAHFSSWNIKGSEIYLKCSSHFWSWKQDNFDRAICIGNWTFCCQFSWIQCVENR